MPMQFSYRGKTANGEVRQGNLAAASAEAAASELLRQGITPLSIRPQAEPASTLEQPAGLALFRRKVGLDELIVFCRQMHALTRAGIPLIRTMRGWRKAPGRQCWQRCWMMSPAGWKVAPPWQPQCRLTRMFFRNCSWR